MYSLCISILNDISFEVVFNIFVFSMFCIEDNVIIINLFLLLDKIIEVGFMEDFLYDLNYSEMDIFQVKFLLFGIMFDVIEYL